MISQDRFDLQVQDLGRMRYSEALALQKAEQEAVIAGRESARPRMTLFLVEHDPPVITVSRRAGSGRNLIATESQLRAAGVEVAETDRGGDITYHGPGQLVVYPILDLNVLNLRLHSYMRWLEQVVIDTIATFGIKGSRDESATGVWVGAPRSSGLAPHASKICAMGVRVSRWVTMHGLALNVTTNLNHFDLIIPCGLVGRSVTSLQRELRERCPAMDEVKRLMVAEFRLAIDRAIVAAPGSPRPPRPPGNPGTTDS